MCDYGQLGIQPRTKHAPALAAQNYHMGKGNTDIFLMLTLREF